MASRRASSEGVVSHVGGRLPDKIAGYTIGKVNGTGSFGAVARAVHDATGMKVAMKIYDKQKSGWQKLIDGKVDVTREGDILRSLQHEHIIWLIEIIDTTAFYCLVTEWAERNLLEVLQEDGAFAEPRAREVTSQLLSAVEHLHSKNVVHRDLKPDNVMVTSNGSIRLIDFGLSNRIESADALLETQCGTMCYSAPEMLCSKAYGREVDIWSIGVCLYVMLTRRLPYESKSLTDLHAMMLDGSFAPPDNASESVNNLLHRLLAVRPADRITVADIWKHPWITGDSAIDNPGVSGGVGDARGGDDHTVSRSGSENGEAVDGDDGDGNDNDNDNDDGDGDNDDDDDGDGDGEGDGDVKIVGTDISNIHQGQPAVHRSSSVPAGGPTMLRRGTKARPSSFKRPSSEHINKDVVVGMVAAGLGTVDTITEAVRANLCNRLSAEYFLRTISLMRGKRAPKWPRSLSAPETRSGSASAASTTTALGTRHADTRPKATSAPRDPRSDGGRSPAARVSSDARGARTMQGANTIPRPLQTQTKVNDISTAGRPVPGISPRVQARLVPLLPHHRRKSQSDGQAPPVQQGVPPSLRPRRSSHGDVLAKAEADVRQLRTRAASDAAARRITINDFDATTGSAARDVGRVPSDRGGSDAVTPILRRHSNGGDEDDALNTTHDHGRSSPRRIRFAATTCDGEDQGEDAPRVGVTQEGKGGASSPDRERASPRRIRFTTTMHEGAEESAQEPRSTSHQLPRASLAMRRVRSTGDIAIRSTLKPIGEIHMDAGSAAASHGVEHGDGAGTAAPLGDNTNGRNISRPVNVNAGGDRTSNPLAGAHRQTLTLPSKARLERSVSSEGQTTQRTETSSLRRTTLRRGKSESALQAKASHQLVIMDEWGNRSKTPSQSQRSRSNKSLPSGRVPWRGAPP